MNAESAAVGSNLHEKLARVDRNRWSQLKDGVIVSRQRESEWCIVYASLCLFEDLLTFLARLRK